MERPVVRGTCRREGDGRRKVLGNAAQTYPTRTCARSRISERQPRNAAMSLWHRLMTTATLSRKNGKRLANDATSSASGPTSRRSSAISCTDLAGPGPSTTIPRAHPTTSLGSSSTSTVLFPGSMCRFGNTMAQCARLSLPEFPISIEREGSVDVCLGSI